MGEGVMNKIIDYFRDMSPGWLLTGEGNMHRTQAAAPQATHRGADKKEIERLTKLLDEKEKELTKYKKQVGDLKKRPCQVAGTTAAEPPIAYKAKDTLTQGIPLIPLDAIAGFTSGGDTQVMDYECERYAVPDFKGAEFLIRVKGSSMYPKYASGDVVACKKLSLDTFFQWNKVYVLDTEQGVLIKRVKPGDDNDHILLVSENVNYSPFTLHRSKIFSLAIVIGVIRLE